MVRQQAGLCWSLGLFAVALIRPAAAVDVAQLSALTEAEHSRIVWLSGGGTVLYGGGAVVGYDSKENRTVNILPSAYRQYRPILCTGGSRVVVTIDAKVYVVNWDGTGKKFVVNGFCSDVWADPASGKEWAIVSTPGTAERDEMSALRRYLLADTTQKISLLDRADRKVGTYFADWMQLSADGTKGLDCLPWPNAGILDFAQPATSPTAGPRLSIGCWPSMASDNSYHWFIFPQDMSHTMLDVFQYRTSVKQNLNLTAPLPQGSTGQYYHPRFASKGGRFFSITVGSTPTAQSGSVDESPGAEVFLGKFSANYQKFDGWVRITQNATPDYCADAWIGVEGTTPSLQLSSAALTFTAKQGGANPPAQDMVVTTSYGTLTDVKAVSDKPWLTVGSPAGSGARFTISNTANVASLPSGQQTATVTVSAANSTPPSKTYTVVVTVTGSAVATSVLVSPAECKAVVNTAAKLTATVLDQEGKPLSPQPAVQWTASGPATATIANGSFSAPKTGVYTVTAASGSLSGVAHVQVVDAQPIVITAPIAGATLSTGAATTIQWTATSAVTGVGIDVSPDNGDTWLRVVNKSITPADPLWGAYPWIVPETLPDATGKQTSLMTNRVKLRVYDYFNGSVEGISDGPITIVKGLAVLERRPTIAGRLTIEYRAGSGLILNVPWSNAYRIAVFALDGTVVAAADGIGPQQLRLATALTRGSYVVRAAGPGRSLIHRFMAP